MDESKKRAIIVIVCSLILVAMLLALFVVSYDVKEEKELEVSSSKKAIVSICQNTDFKQTCMATLEKSGVDTTDPHELLKIAFQATQRYMKEAAKNSTTLQEVEKDPKAKDALQMCKELTNQAIRDLERSFTKFNTIDISNVDDILLDLKIWLSGAITQQETCLDGFQDVEGDSGMKTREALATAMEMTSNALAMVEELSAFLEGMGIQSFQSRRLLTSDGSAITRHGDSLPEWVDLNDRKLIVGLPHKIKPDLVVAKDGSGKYTSINAALIDIPKKSNKTFVLYIKEGVYNEIVKINSSITHLMMLGDGPCRTRITGNLNYIDGVGTYHTATVAVQGDHFIARDIAFENSAGPQKHQAVALRVSADRAMFFNCRMDGYQDTLYTHAYRQFYRDCVISGTIDFVFGDSAVVFQSCTFLVRRPLDNQQCIVTTQGRKEVRQPTGIVLQNCTITADKGYFPVPPGGRVKAYLGRPWKEFSRTIIMESFIDTVIEPEGWLPWNETFALETLFYTEFNNRGPASPKIRRVRWPGVKELPPERVERFTADPFVDGNRWVPLHRIPYIGGFMFPAPKVDPNVQYSPLSPGENKDLGSEAAPGESSSSSSSSSSSATFPPSPSPAPQNYPGPTHNARSSSIWNIWVNPFGTIRAPTPTPAASPTIASRPAPGPAASGPAASVPAASIAAPPYGVASAPSL